MLHRLRILLPPLLLIGFALAPLMTLGQSDGAAPPSDTPVDPVPASETTSAPALEASSRPTGVETAVPSTTASTPASASAPATPEPVSATPSTASTGSTGSPQAGLPPVVFENTPTSSTDDTGMSPIIWIVLAALAVVPFGFFAAKVIKGDGVQKDPSDKGDKKDCKRCFDIRRILEEKLAELTDLRGKLEGKLKGMARDQVRETVKGTPAESVFAAAEKAEKEYGRLKKLFEECMIEFERDALKGVVVEESLADKKVLEQIKVEKTRQAGDRTIHDVLASKATIAEFQKYLADGPWYAYFWKPGKDDVTIVFKEKTFAIRSSDRSTWDEAIAYGSSIGIPEGQFDLPTK